MPIKENLAFDPSVLVNEINIHADPLNITTLKKALQDGEYTDKSGIKWKVRPFASEDDMFSGLRVTTVDDFMNIDTTTISNRGYSMKNHKDDYERHRSFNSFYWQRSRNAVDSKCIFFVNGCAVTFTHKHEIRVKFASWHGKPADIYQHAKHLENDEVVPRTKCLI